MRDQTHLKLILRDFYYTRHTVPKPLQLLKDRINSGDHQTSAGNEVRRRTPENEFNFLGSRNENNQMKSVKKSRPKLNLYIYLNVFKPNLSTITKVLRHTLQPFWRLVPLALLQTL